MSEIEGKRMSHHGEGGREVIRLEGLEKVYQSGGDVEVRAVKGVSLRVCEGEFVAVMGASGSGKSTLMNMIGCLDRPTRGKYYLDGEEVGGKSKSELSRVRNQRLGFVFQGFNLLSRTSALENVELPMLYAAHSPGRSELRRRSLAALERVGLAGRAGHHPNQMSGGQQQRVAIARALVNEPSLLLADEPTGNLDTRTSLEIMKIFQELNDAGMTILMVTHEPDIALYCRRKIVMRDGVVVSDEPVEVRLSAAEELRKWGEGDAVAAGESAGRSDVAGVGEGGAQ
jgi:putative ABC transport system ATP-binding protein